jgi:RNA polymerase sigma factor (sigma-70 family)
MTTISEQMSRKRISKEGRLQDYHPDVGIIWRSRNEELEKEVFDQLPSWMYQEEADSDKQIDLERLMPKVLEHLTKRERMLMVSRYVNEYTLEEVGVRFDVTRERIRQIEKHAIRRLLHPSRSADLRTLLDVFYLRNIRHQEAREAARKANEEFLAKYTEDKLLKKLLKLHET